MPNKMNFQQFGATVKAKHPEYQDMDDEDLGRRVLAKYPQYSDMVDTTPPPAPAQPTMGQQALGAAKDFGTGLLKGAGSTANNIGHILYPDFLAKHLTGAPSVQQQENYFKPTNTAQAVGKGFEQAGEFMIPGAAEESGAAKISSLIPKVGKLAPRLLTSAIGSGLVNKAQGGSFTGGAAAGAGGTLVGAGLKAAAPLVAESALGIPKAARAFGRTPGKAILEETKGFQPSAIGKSAEDRIAQLRPELESAASRSTNTVSLLPARQHITDKMLQAERENAPTAHARLNDMGNSLRERFSTKQAIPQDVSASEALDLKRGFGKEHASWNPEVHNPVLSTGRHVYGLLDKGFDQAVPEGAQLNQRISSLIPVARRAESASREPSLLGRTVGRFGKQTGALTMAGLGATAGYARSRSPEGALVGGAAGLVGPELIASPETQMVVARGLNSARGLRPAVGSLLQLTRGSTGTQSPKQ